MNANKDARPTTVKRVERTEYEKNASRWLDTEQAEMARRYEIHSLETQMLGMGIDLSVPNVKCGPIYTGIPERVLDAEKRIREADAYVGGFSATILKLYICQGMTSKQVAAHFGHSGDRKERYYKERFRDTCSELINHWQPRAARRNKRANFIRNGQVVFDPTIFGKGE